MLENNITKEKIELSQDFITFPDALNVECSKDEFHKMMSSHNSDIPIERVNFKGCPEVKTEQ